MLLGLDGSLPPAAGSASRPLVAVAAVLALVACDVARPAPRDAGLAGTRWALQAFEPPDRPPATPVGAITLDFAAGRDEVTGSGGCNLYRADYRLDGTALALSPIDTSRMVCSRGRVMADERDFFLALESAAALEHDGEGLRIDAAGGWRLRFAPAPGPAERGGTATP